MQHHTPIGYKMIKGIIEIDERQSKIVQQIFKEYLSGKSMQAIAGLLTKEGALNTKNKPSWTHSSIGKILKNVKYQGNDYYPALVTKEAFENAQIKRSKIEMKLGRTKQANAMRNQSVFSSMVKCGECGQPYRKYVEHVGKAHEKERWRCKHYILRNQVSCKNHSLMEQDIETIFIKATNQLLREKWRISKINPQEPPKISNELRNIEVKIKDLESNGSFSDPELSKLIFKRAELYYQSAKVYDQPSKTERLKAYLKGVSQINQFDNELFVNITDKITVYKDNALEVQFINGAIIKLELKELGKDDADGNCKKDGGDHTTSDKV